MQDKENVYVEENCPTEQGSALMNQQMERRNTEGSADLGKFKDVNALLQAYHSLQAEFTRRSQRLKRYEEAEKDNRVRAEAQKTEESNDGIAAADAPRGQSEDRTESARPDSSIEENIATMQCQPQKQGAEAAEKTNNNESTTHREGISATHSVEKQTPSLYELATADESVRLRIVGDYLSSIGKSGAPLIKGGSGVLASPIKKPNSISEAGNLALVYLRARNGEA